MGLRRFGRYEVDLFERSPGVWIACYEGARFRPRPSSEIFDEAGLRAAIQAGVRWVLVDMAALVILSSATVGEMVKVADLFRRHGGDLQLVGLGPLQTIVLDMLGLGTFFVRHADRTAALASLLKYTPE